MTTDSSSNAAVADAPTLNAAPTGPMQKAIVKLVLSGDTVVIRGQPRGGPPPEKTISLAGINAPRLGRREGAGGSAEVKDEPYAWEAREMLRKATIGKEIRFTVDYKVNSGREFVRLYVGDSSSDELGANQAEALVSAGLVEVRVGQRGLDEYSSQLNDLQEKAKSAKIGRWSDTPSIEHVRNITWQHENPRMFVDSMKQTPVDAVIEHVRDGSTIRAMLLPSFTHVTVMFSGIKSPVLRVGTGGEILEAEQFSDEAKYFTESRLLHRDVQIVLEGVSNANFTGTIIHPAGSIGEALLREGLAKCVDWSIGQVTGGPEKYRQAEKQAKEKRLRIWRSYTPSAAVSADKKTYTAKVVEIIMGDNLMVIRDGEKTPYKIALASIRCPRLEDAGIDKESKPIGRDFRPLYDIPYVFEAREFLRKRLIGKKVNVTVDYVQPASNGFPDRTCCTVVQAGVNVAEALLSKGLALCIRYRQDDDNRSSQYDTLLAAEAKAEKDKLKIHELRAAGKPDKAPTLRVQDLQGDANKAKQFFPYLQRAGRSDAIVEFVASGSRVRVFVPKETCLVTLLLAGISCPRGSRITPGADGKRTPAEPYGDEAMAFTKNMVLQHEVHIEVEGQDKAGNMIGWMFVDGNKSMSELLVAAGLADVHFTAERTRYYSPLCNALQKAKNAKLNMWTNYVEVDTAEAALATQAAEMATERKTSYRRIIVTDATPVERHIRIGVQFVDDGARLEQLMSELRADLTEHPPTTGAYSPRRNDLCLAKFDVDQQWYRARIESVKSTGCDVVFLDFGNRATVQAVDLATLPEQFRSSASGAKDYYLALVQTPVDEEDAWAAVAALQRECSAGDADISMNVEYKIGNAEFVTLIPTAKIAPPAGSSADAEEETESFDVAARLTQLGYTILASRRDKRLQGLVSAIQTAQDVAKRERANIWRYGDPTGDDV